MTIASEQKRIDDIEIYLSPKEHGIQLVQEMRKYPNDREFLEAVMTTEYRDCIYFKPLSKLTQQAEARYPGKSPQDMSLRIQLDRKLRIEFQELKLLVKNINDIVKEKAKTIALLAAVEISYLATLIKEDCFCGLGVVPSRETNG